MDADITRWESNLALETDTLVIVALRQAIANKKLRNTVEMFTSKEWTLSPPMRLPDFIDHRLYYLNILVFASRLRDSQDLGAKDRADYLEQIIYSAVQMHLRLSYDLTPK